MSDPILEAARAVPPQEPLLGLRRRHPTNSLRQHDIDVDVDVDVDVDDDGEVETTAGGSFEDNNSVPLNNTIEFASVRTSTTHVNNELGNGDGENRPTQTINLFAPLSGSVGIGMFRISRLYCFLSILTALMAIVSAPVPTQRIEYNDMVKMIRRITEGSYPVWKGNPVKSNIKQVGGEGNKFISDDNGFTVDKMTTIVADLKSWSFEEFLTSTFVDKKRLSMSTSLTSATFLGRESKKEDDTRVSKSRFRKWIEQINCRIEEIFLTFLKHMNKFKSTEQKVRWMDSRNSESTSHVDKDDSNRREGNGKLDNRRERHKELQWIDQCFWESDSYSDIVTNIIDKLLKSTIRLCIITNFLLTMTYLLHSAVAAWFLSHSGFSGAYTHNGTIRQQHDTNLMEVSERTAPELPFGSSSRATGTRERMGGFLIFKLLLISAVLEPDTLDLMILVTWFTLLDCLRSLDHLAHSTSTHLAAMGQPPKKGVVQILYWVLVCNIGAAVSCAALFHTAGHGMVLLLTCDCALLGTSTLSHILKYYQSVFEYFHDDDIRDLEERQLNLHHTNEGVNTDNSIEQDEENEEVNGGHPGNQEHSSSATAIMSSTHFQRESSRLDHEMECLELAHSQRLSILDTAIFSLEMTCNILTVAHFCHIWALHGVQFTVIDGVLALHLHSAISTAYVKLARRRNVHKITRDLEGHFSNATDEELKKASIDGDVCCICLGSMTKGFNVKKGPCGHIYHTHCLREVIERAQNLQSAKCPLCRAPFKYECGSITNVSRGVNNNNFVRERNTTNNPRISDLLVANPAIDSDTQNDGNDGSTPGHLQEGDIALFRFSTEGILPIWLPLPAFSLEVIRRPSLDGQAQAQLPNHLLGNVVSISPQRAESETILSPNQRLANPQVGIEDETESPHLQQQHQDAQIPFFQRILTFVGLVPMSREEEERALAQLVDMFPQHDRSDLLRELRNRGSLEAVTEAILIGIFPGTSVN